MLDAIPPDVFRELQTHLRIKARQAQNGWRSASQDEDTLTGDFGGQLRTDWMQVETPDGRWLWKVDYTKFRGRGKNALEKEIGADGIVVVEAQQKGGVLITKGVIFQSKKAHGSSRTDLRDQVEKMEEAAPGGSAVFEFGPDGYRADSGEVVLSEFAARPNRIPHPSDSIDHFLADRFLVCTSGLRGMYYDAVRKNLLVPLNDGGRVISAGLRHRLRIQVAPAGVMFPSDGY